MGTTGEVRAYFGRSKPPVFALITSGWTVRNTTQNVQKLTEFEAPKQKNFYGDGAQPPPQTLPPRRLRRLDSRACGADLGAYGVSSSACLLSFWAVSPPLRSCCTNFAQMFMKFIDYFMTDRMQYTGWPKKVSYYQMIKKSFLIVLKPVNEITFIRQIKSWIKHYNIICWD